MGFSSNYSVQSTLLMLYHNPVKQNGVGCRAESGAKGQLTGLDRGLLDLSSYLPDLQFQGEAFLRSLQLLLWYGSFGTIIAKIPSDLTATSRGHLPGVLTLADCSFLLAYMICILLVQLNLAQSFFPVHNFIISSFVFPLNVNHQDVIPSLLFILLILPRQFHLLPPVYCSPDFL